MIKLRKIYFIFILMLSACSSAQKIVNFIPYIGKKDEVNVKRPIDPESVKVMAETLPEGLTLKNNIIEVEEAYKNQYKILGRLEIVMSPGIQRANLLPHNGGLAYFWDPENASSLQNYCYYNYLNFLPFPGINYINPLTWPCLFMNNYSGEEEESVRYREALLINSAKKKAAEMGGNIVAGLIIGSRYSPLSPGGAFAGQAWSASGFVVAVLKNTK